MFRRSTLSLLTLTCVCMVSICTTTNGDDSVVESSQIQKFTNDELRALVAPIALYPDPLLA